jgi:hypothetical protein
MSKMAKRAQRPQSPPPKAFETRSDQFEAQVKAAVVAMRLQSPYVGLFARHVQGDCGLWSTAQPQF